MDIYDREEEPKKQKYLVSYDPKKLSETIDMIIEENRIGLLAMGPE